MGHEGVVLTGSFVKNLYLLTQTLPTFTRPFIIRNHNRVMALQIFSLLSVQRSFPFSVTVSAMYLFIFTHSLQIKGRKIKIFIKKGTAPRIKGISCCILWVGPSVRCVVLTSKRLHNLINYSSTLMSFHWGSC